MSRLPEDIENLIYSYRPPSTINGWVHLWAHTLDKILRTQYPTIPRRYEPTYNVGNVHFVGNGYDFVDDIWREWIHTYEDAIRQTIAEEHGTEQGARVGGRIHAFGNGGSLMEAMNREKEIEEREKEIEERVLAHTMHLLKRRVAWKKKISESEAKHHHLREAYMKSQRDNERLAGIKDRSRRELEMQVEDLEHGLPGQPIKVEMDRKGKFVDDDKTRLHKKQGGLIRHKRFI